MTCENIKNRVRNGAKIVDVREEVEFMQNRLPHAINIPLSRFEFIDQLLDKSDEILLYCRSGARSEAAKDYLVQLGYNATNIGGIIHYPGCV